LLKSCHPDEKGARLDNSKPHTLLLSDDPKALAVERRRKADPIGFNRPLHYRP
jgi:hypothetical protein